MTVLFLRAGGFFGKRQRRFQKAEPSTQVFSAEKNLLRHFSDFHSIANALNLHRRLSERGTMLSITLSRARASMSQAGLSAAMLAKLCDIAPSTLSAAYRDQLYLGSEKEAELMTMTLRVQELQEALKPFREPTGVDDLRRVLDFIEENSIQPEQIRVAITSVFGVSDGVE